MAGPDPDAAPAISEHVAVVLRLAQARDDFGPVVGEITLVFVGQDLGRCIQSPPVVVEHHVHVELAQLGAKVGQPLQLDFVSVEVR